MKLKYLYEVKVSVNKYQALDYNTVTKKVDSVLISNPEDENEGFGWFYNMFGSRKEAIRFYKHLVMSSTASNISVTLSQSILNSDKTITDTVELCNIDMFDEDVQMKDIAKILRKIK